MARLSKVLDTAILQTVLYSSIFNFPLSRKELWYYLNSNKKISYQEFSKHLKLCKFLVSRSGYFALYGFEGIITKRLKNLRLYKHKLQLARRGVRILSYIPSILFIGLSGSLAAGNVSPKADIDFFVITKQNSVWFTRFCSIVLMHIFGLRRVGKCIENKICLNIFLDETALAYFSHTQDLYTAREIAQLTPLLNREKTYEKFLKANSWYMGFLPNAKPQQTLLDKSITNIWGLHLIRLVDPYFFILQRVYMRKKITREVVERKIILFHPRDYREQILHKYNLKLMEYDSLTKI